MKSLGVGLLLLASVSSYAEDKLQATMAAGGQKVVLTHGLALIDAKGEVSVRLFGAALNPKEQARAMQDGGAIFGVLDAPNAQVDLHFKQGAARAEVPSFESCHIGFYGFAVGPFDWNAFASGCGAVEFSGDLKPGGVVHGKLKGQGQGFPRQSGPGPVYAWDVDFTATLRAKP